MKQILNLLFVIIGLQLHAQQLKLSAVLTPNIGSKSWTQGCQTIGNARYFCNLYSSAIYINGTVLDTSFTTAPKRIMLSKHNAANQVIAYKYIGGANGSNTYITYVKFLAHHSYLYIQFDISDTMQIGNQLFYNNANNLKSMVVKLDTNLNIINAAEFGESNSLELFESINDSSICISHYGHNQFIDTNLIIKHVDSCYNNAGGFNGVKSKNTKSYYNIGGYFNNWNNVQPIFDTATFNGPLPAMGYGGHILARYDAYSHRPIWVIGLTGLNQTFNTDFGYPVLAIDNNNQAILSTSYSGPQILLHDGSQIGGGGCVVIKYDTNGHILWKDFCMYGSIRNIEVDTANNIYVCGGMNSTSSINNAFGGKVYNHGESGMFIGKYSPAGQELWSFVINNPIQKGGFGGTLKVWAEDSFEVYGVYKTATFAIDTFVFPGDLPTVQNGFYLAAKVVNDALQITPSNKPINNVLVYPNPTSNNCTITYNGQPTMLQVYNTSGQLVYTTKPLPNTTTIAAAAWPIGLYNIQLSWPTGNSTTIPFIHQ